MKQEDLYNHNLKYRPDIDGLRAIAVISVILFHFNNKILPGGFVGVDIFFVISGFLITSIIYREMLSGEFSFIEFYKRRIKRIMPAFFVCMIVTAIVGFSVLIKGDMKPFARSIISSIFSAANIYFYKTLNTGYFDDNSNETPLLHMWSLGVEEQFYMLWPFVLLILTKRNYRVLVTVVSSLIFVSFICAEMMLYENVKYAYYIILPRAGELLMGSLLALMGLKMRPKQNSTKTAEIIAVAGLGLIIWSIIYTSKSHFPGVSAIWPCLGTVMTIYAGFSGNCLVNRFLSLRPVVFIGLISYSLYLWHWPVIAFSNYLYLSSSPYYMVSSSALILSLSLGSYYLVELPIRRAKMSRAQVFILLYLVPAIVISGVSVSFCNVKVREYFVPTTEETEMDVRFAPTDHYSHYCFAREKVEDELIKAKSCINGYNPNKEPNVLFFGDSHAAHFVDFLDTLGKHYRFSFRALSLSGCPSVFTNILDYGRDELEKGRCRKFNNLVRAHILQYKYVVLSSRMEAAEYSDKPLKHDFEDTIKWLSLNQVKVIILGNVPEFENFKMNLAERKSRIKWIPSTSYHVHEMQSSNSFLEELSHKYQEVHYMDATKIICPNGICNIYMRDKLIYADNNHITMGGSKVLGEEFIQNNIKLAPIFVEISKSQEQH